MTTRRAFLTLTAAGWVANGLTDATRTMDGRIVGASSTAGHRLRAPIDTNAIDDTSRADVVIVGSGVSGLSAAWRMQPHGLDVRVLELEPFMGGTSSFGEEGDGVAYPWGAHYLPAPNREARATIKLLEEMQVIRGYDAAARPLFDGRVLCHSPDERLFYEGAWHQGLVPSDLLSEGELDELVRFQAAMQVYEEARGSDGRAAFQIPVDLSSRDPTFLALDKLTMAEFMDRERFVSRFVRWHVRYAMLDDFGAEPEHVSAWAGIHYFASRKLETPQLEGGHYLVWPEGNGHLVRELAARGEARVESGAMVVAITSEKDHARVVYFDPETGRLRAIQARAVVVATPSFIARRIASFASALPTRVSSPWVVANLHVSREYEPNQAWDSVLFAGDGLGYVDSSHQRAAPSKQTVLTYFRAFGDGNPAATRERLVRASWDSLAGDVFRDLAPAHPDLRPRTSKLDVMVWGHAMPRPTPGFLGDGTFERVRRLAPRITYGHVDLVGVALFEEAQRAGVLAAELALADAGVSAGETWT